MYIRIAGKAMISNTALAWLGNGDIRPRTNSNMFRNPGVKSATGRANVVRLAPCATVFIYYTGSQSTREVVFVTKQGRYLCFVYCFKTILGVTSLMYLEFKNASSILNLSDWGPKYGGLK